MEKKNTWETYSSKQLKELEKINAQYRDFLDNGKTERECIDTIVNTIEKSGYRELESLIKEGAALKTGDDSNVWMYLLVVVCGGMICGIIAKERKRRAVK